MREDENVNANANENSGKYARATVAEDVSALIPNIPPEDNEDVIRGWGMTSAEALRMVFPMCDECFTIISGERVVGIFGVMPDPETGVGTGLPAIGNIFLMRADGIESVALRFCRHGHEYLDRWLLKYGVLTGYISKKYGKFISWLLWEGFEIADVGRGYLRVRKYMEG